MVDTGRAVERNILACMLSDPLCLEKVNLPVQAFESKELQVVYSVIQELKDLGYESINLNTLKNHWDSRRDFQATLQEHGGISFLNNLATKPDLPNFQINLDSFANKYRTNIAKNRILMAADTIRGGKFSTADQVFEILDEHLLDKDDQATHEVIRFEEVNVDWLEQQAERYEKGEFKVVGHPILDSSLAEAFDGSFLHGSLIVWTGTTNVGKSLLCTMLCVTQSIKLGIPTLVIDNELTAPEFRARLLANLSGVPFRAILRGEAYNRYTSEYAQLHTGLTTVKQSPIEWRKIPDISIERIEPVLRRFLRQYKDHPHKQLIIDGIKMSTDSDSYLQVGFFAQRLKTHIASRYSDQGLVVHTTCQLNRSGGSYAVKKNKDDHPTHENIALSKLIADNADTVCVLAPVTSEDGAFDKTRRKIYITKARNHSVMVGHEFILLDCNGPCCQLSSLGRETPNGFIETVRPEGFHQAIPKTLESISAPQQRSTVPDASTLSANY